MKLKVVKPFLDKTNGCYRSIGSIIDISIKDRVSLLIEKGFCVIDETDLDKKNKISIDPDQCDNIDQGGLNIKKTKKTKKYDRSNS